jgi:hypothetical protein
MEDINKTVQDFSDTTPCSLVDGQIPEDGSSAFLQNVGNDVTESGSVHSHRRENLRSKKTDTC